MIELEFNQNTNKFGIKGFNLASGDETVDNTIKSTVQSALDMNLSTNMSVMGGLSGNPVLIIKF